ncbi:hypothetical protein VPNG_03019 [Cytospora leucostoma]|uniref:Uncharacterized protein n=1 Tax=Cytospora leucostoma TaxID=1230097 RepID=A0A423XGK0_9PEZI|nr:hypothetical protein VPNG_03019 [Cytospora leucostoma]
MSEEAPEPAPERPSKYSQQIPTRPDVDRVLEDVEELVRATKLCATCCPMFGPSQSPEPYNKFPYNDYPYDDINYPYEHWEVYHW